MGNRLLRQMQKRHAPKDILQLIEDAARHRARHLDLSGNNIVFLPLQITQLKDLRSLDLSRNHIAILPPKFIELSNLESLDLSFNRLSELPQEVTNLERLTRLDLSFNDLSSLPAHIKNLRNLTALYLGGNRLSSLPEEMSELKQLTSLILTSNGITNVPSVITELIGLTSLGLSANQLISLPSEITALSNLKDLDLSGNRLAKLPPSITDLSNLLVLDLRENSLPLAPEVLAEGTEVKAIFAAIAGLISGKRLNEAKMLVLGDGDVGKSSVVERLVYDTYDPRKQTTVGVKINDEMKVLHSDVRADGEPIRLNIWDFGGQEIQHSTHQFFLTTRSLYLLVVDARKGDQISNIEYWLKLIGSFGGDSPILVVVNQIDQLQGQRPLNLDRRGLQRKYNVREVIETSC
jgi:internalin A